MVRVLIVEDNDRLRESMVMLLGLHDIEAVGVPDSEAAEFAITGLDQLTESEGYFVITDHNLGEGKETGLDYAIRLKARGIPVCISSAKDMSFEADKEGISFYIKPANLLKIVDQMSQGG